MQKEQISSKEAIFMLATFTMGSTLIIGTGGGAKNDAWIAGLVGLVMAFPVIAVYSRIISLFPGKDLYDILGLTLGKIVGKVLAVIYIWYAFHLGALVIRNFGEFVNTVSMPETPMLVPMLFMAVVVIFSAKSGVEVMARMTSYLLLIVLLIIGIVQLLGIPHLNPDYIKPILGSGFSTIINSGFSAFAFPFAETVLFLGIFFSLKTTDSPYKVYFLGVLLAGALIILLTTRNILVLGDFAGKIYFPSYVAVSRLSVGDFVQRIEVTVAIVFVICATIKATICLYVASKGIGKLLNLDDYRSIVIQTGLLMVYLSHIIYDNTMEMRYWAFKVYNYYAFPFQVIFPLLLLVAVEIKAGKLERKN